MADHVICYRNQTILKPKRAQIVIMPGKQVLTVIALGKPGCRANPPIADLEIRSG